MGQQQGTNNLSIEELRATLKAALTREREAQLLAQARENEMYERFVEVMHIRGVAMIRREDGSYEEITDANNTDLGPGNASLPLQPTYNATPPPLTIGSHPVCMQTHGIGMNAQGNTPPPASQPNQAQNQGMQLNPQGGFGKVGGLQPNFYDMMSSPNPNASMPPSQFGLQFQNSHQSQPQQSLPGFWLLSSQNQEGFSGGQFRGPQLQDGSQYQIQYHFSGNQFNQEGFLQAPFNRATKFVLQRVTFKNLSITKKTSLQEEKQVSYHLICLA